MSSWPDPQLKKELTIVRHGLIPPINIQRVFKELRPHYTPREIGWILDIPDSGPYNCAICGAISWREACKEHWRTYLSRQYWQQVYTNPQGEKQWHIVARKRLKEVKKYLAKRPQGA